MRLFVTIFTLALFLIFSIPASAQALDFKVSPPLLKPELPLVYTKTWQLSPSKTQIFQGTSFYIGEESPLFGSFDTSGTASDAIFRGAQAVVGHDNFPDPDHEEYNVFYHNITTGIQFADLPAGPAGRKVDIVQAELVYNLRENGTDSRGWIREVQGDGKVVDVCYGVVAAKPREDWAVLSTDAQSPGKFVAVAGTNELSAASGKFVIDVTKTVQDMHLENIPNYGFILFRPEVLDTPQNTHEECVSELDQIKLRVTYSGDLELFPPE